MKYTTKEDLLYLKNNKWLSGELCYWRDNPQYSEKTKKKLEQRLKEMTKKSITYETYRQKND
jgi:hypothetical protein